MKNADFGHFGAKIWTYVVLHVRPYRPTPVWDRPYRPHRPQTWDMELLGVGQDTRVCVLSLPSCSCYFTGAPVTPVTPVGPVAPVASQLLLLLPSAAASVTLQ